ncbi:amidohydrolase family protein [Algivirga pacifica]|uniref:Amidohydrolase family protein n=1 Tax=Algivirga pacifica TaxID=1162670 RepID=A0ABP9DKZ0_9BACT
MNIQVIKQAILSSPLERIPEKMRTLLANELPFVDVHTHLFNYKDVPDKFLGVRFPMHANILQWTENILDAIIPWDAEDSLSLLADFIDEINSEHSEEVFQHLCSFYRDDVIFGVLTMDMSIGIEGNVMHEWEMQMEIIKQLRDKHPTRIVPFAAIDPRREDALNKFHQAFAADGPYQFAGLKIYPSLGYVPSHPRMMQMLEICEEKQIPVIAHCSGASVKASSNVLTVEYTELDQDGQQVHKSNEVVLETPQDYSDTFNDPIHWTTVLEAYPNLKLNLAHFGGADQWNAYQVSTIHDTWVDTILGFMEKYPHVYADFSYTMAFPELGAALQTMMTQNKTVRHRTLFGSDYYMLLQEGKYQRMLDDFAGKMGADYMYQIGVHNTHRFLFGIEKEVTTEKKHVLTSKKV